MEFTGITVFIFSFHPILNQFKKFRGPKTKTDRSLMEDARISGVERQCQINF